MKILITIFFGLFIQTTFSQVIWYADPDKNYLESFYRLSKETGEDAFVSTTIDPEFGKVWVVNKPIGSKRAEFTRSEPTDMSLPRYAPTEGDTKYIGWKMKISIVGTVQPPDFEVFQLKSYPEGTQNYPIDIEYNKGKLVLEAFNPGTGSQSSRGRDLCEVEVGEGNWVSLVLGIKFSNKHEDGYVEFWVNGVKQDLLNDDENKRAKHRTLDDTGNYFKWGAYKALVYDFDITNYLDEMRIANTYEEAEPLNYEKVDENAAPLASFIEPTKTQIEVGYSEMYVSVEASDPDGDNITSVLKIDGRAIRQITQPPYKWGVVGSIYQNETLGLTVGSHEFEVITTDSKGLSTNITKTIVVDNATSVFNNQNNKTIIVYPNPNSEGLFYLNTTTPWEIFNTKGALIQAGKDSLINLSKEAEGVYFLKTEYSIHKMIKK